MKKLSWHQVMLTCSILLFLPFPFVPFQWADLWSCPCILPRLCHVVGCRQSWGTAGWGRGKELCTNKIPFKFSAPTILAEDALCRFWSLLGHLVALAMLEAKSVFCIRPLCFSVLILAMLSWHQPTQRYTRQSNAFVRPYYGGYLCHVAEYFCFPSASNCSRGHSIALCAAVGVKFGWVYVYFQYLYARREKLKYVYGIRWALRQSCDALDT